MNIIIITLLGLLFVELTFLLIVTLSRQKPAKTAKKIFIDSSTLIDGRIINLASTGFLQGYQLLIPRSVLRELQLLADKAEDKQRRDRARAGLDTASAIERLERANVEIYQDEIQTKTRVDDRLIDLAKKYSGLLMTNDFTLIKLAAAEKVEALNINDLASAMRPEYRVGDRLTVAIVAKGDNKDQGTGYTPSGTLVVVDRASASIGKTLDIEITNTRQTSSGVMLFAKKAAK